MKIFNSILRLFRKTYVLNVGIDTGDLKKPTIIMLHGIAATSLMWDKISNELKDTHRVIGIDLLGFGNSPYPIDCEYTVDDHMNSVRKTIKGLKIKKPYIIVGHSMGSIIALKYASKFQKEISHLYLMSIPVYQKDNTDEKSVNKKIDIYRKIYQTLIDNKNFTLSVAKNMRSLFGGDESFNVTEDNWHSFRESLIQTIVNQNTLDLITKTKIPIDVIYGSIDTLLIQDRVDCLGIYKNVRVTKIPLVGHFVDKRYSKLLISMIKHK